VIDELGSDPSIDATHIGATAEKGVVTLTSHGKLCRESGGRACLQRVRGVLAVVQEVEVRLPGDNLRRRNCRAGAEGDCVAPFLPEGTIKVEVQRGYVTLTGTVDGHYQTVATEAAVRKLTGVAGVTNLIALRSCGRRAPRKWSTKSRRRWSAMRMWRAFA
jgi:osmotically-inducible protein OsmY